MRYGWDRAANADFTVYAFWGEGERQRKRKKKERKKRLCTLRSTRVLIRKYLLSNTIIPCGTKEQS